MNVGGLSSRRLRLCGKSAPDANTIGLSRIEIYNGFKTDLKKLILFQPSFSEPKFSNSDILLGHSRTGMELTINGRNGLLKAIRNTKLQSNMKTELSFVDYGERGP